MSLNNSLLAEQSIYARLVVSRIRPNITTFQRNTIPSDGENSFKLYDYYALDDTENLTNQANTDEYAITSLPDTLAYLPRYSIFDHLMLITDRDQDYRRLFVASDVDSYFAIDGPSVMTTRTPSMLTTTSLTRAINPDNNPREAIFTEKPPSFLLTQRSNVTSFVDGINIDHRFDGLNDQNISEQFGNLIVEILNYTSSESQKEPAQLNARTSVYRLLGISDEVQQYVMNNDDIEVMRKDATIVKAYLAKLYVVNDINVTDANARGLASLINNAVNEYRMSEPMQS